MNTPGSVTKFIRHHYRHFNSAALIDAAEGYRKHMDQGGKMMITLAGAMSTAELGLSLAEMIRQDKVNLITTTGPTSRKTFSTWWPTTTTSGCRTIDISPPRTSRICSAAT